MPQREPDELRKQWSNFKNVKLKDDLSPALAKKILVYNNGSDPHIRMRRFFRRKRWSSDEVML